MAYLNSFLLHVFLLAIFFLLNLTFINKKDKPVNVVPIQIIDAKKLSETVNIPKKTIKREEKKIEPPKKNEEVIKKEIKTTSSDRIILKEKKKTENISIKPSDQISKKIKKSQEQTKKNLKIEKVIERKKEEVIDLDNIAALVDKQLKKEQANEILENIDIYQGGTITDNQELLANDIAMLQKAMVNCWTPPIGAPNPEKLVVTLSLRFNNDGYLLFQPTTVNSREINFSNNRFWKAAERAALNAARECQPYDFLSEISLSQEIILTFDPAKMAGF